MFRSQVAFALALLILTSTPGQGRAQEQFVYLVYASGKASDQRALTGFRVRGLKGIVTALHGVADSSSIRAKSAKGLILDDPLTLRKVDVAHDVALLSSPELERLGAEGLDVASDVDVAWGDLGQLRVIGYPVKLSLEELATTLEVRRPPLKPLKTLVDADILGALQQRGSPDPAHEVLSLQGHILPGHSGAPVLDARNRVVAVANGGLQGGAIEISWAIPFPAVRWMPAEPNPELAALRQRDTRVLFAFDDNPRDLGAQINALREEFVHGMNDHLKRIDEQTAQLQKAFIEEKSKSSSLSLGVMLAAYRAEPSPEVKHLTDDLAKLVDQFRQETSGTNVLPVDDLRVRLAEATIANASGRYQRSLDLVGERDEVDESQKLVKVLMSRGNALYGLRQWRQGLVRYERVLAIQPENLWAEAAAMVGLGVLGQSDEMLKRADRIIARGGRDGPKDDWEQRMIACALLERGLFVFKQAGRQLEGWKDIDDATSALTKLAARVKNPLISAVAIGTSSYTRGSALETLNRPAEAIPEYRKAAESLTPVVDRPGHAGLADLLAVALNRQGCLLAANGQLPEAIASIDRAMAIRKRRFDQGGDADHAQLLADSLRVSAWLHATAPDPAFRDGAKAISLATRACELTEWKNPLCLDALAAAYAETGDFAQAVQWEEKALDLASEGERPFVRARIELYKSQKPFRTPTHPNH